MSLSKKICEQLYIDFGDEGNKYLNYKLSEKGLKSIDNLPSHLQKNFLYSIIEELYDDFITKDSIQARIFISIFGLLEGTSYLFWRKFLKGMPPVNFIYYFFGKSIGLKLKKIEEKRIGLIDISSYGDLDQFDFIIVMMNNIFKDYIDLQKDIKDKFYKFCIKGSSRKLDGFVKEQGDKIIYSLKEYVLDNSSKNDTFEINSFFRMIENYKETEEISKRFYNSSHDKKISADIGTLIAGQLGKYIKGARHVVIQGKRNAGIIDFDDASDSQKKLFLKYVLDNSSLDASSHHKASMLRNWLERTLGVS